MENIVTLLSKWLAVCVLAILVRPSQKGSAGKGRGRSRAGFWASKAFVSSP